MALRLLTVLILLLVSSKATAQNSPEGQARRDSIMRAWGGQLPPRAPEPPAFAPPAATQMNRADRQGVLRASAAYLRAGASNPSRLELAGSDSVVFDPRYHSLPGSGGYRYGADHAHVNIPADELAILQAGLRARTAPRESVLPTNCSFPGECYLAVPQFYMLSEPVLRSDGTVTIAVEQIIQNLMISPRRRPWFSVYELVLIRGQAGTWIVNGNRLILMS